MLTVKLFALQNKALIRFHALRHNSYLHKLLIKVTGHRGQPIGDQRHHYTTSKYRLYREKLLDVVYHNYYELQASCQTTYKTEEFPIPLF
ncbi:MAG: hypothetical protein DDT23_00974 [candidate division WS2 bacterium]|nr:hypothetical protein [Candidatus Lithacetigena glycinireducens]